MANKSDLIDRLKRLRIVQGPLAGVSTSAFRELIWQYSNPAWVCSEMVSCQTIMHGHEQIRKRYLHVGENEGPVCLQIAAKNPQEAATACQIISDLPFAMIDLNVGCPVKKIRKRGAGSKLLADGVLLGEIVKAMIESTHLPISVKIRVDGDSGDHFNDTVLRAIADAGPDCLVVHGRSYLDDYKQPCRLGEIKFFVDNLDMPVIGNGDVADAASVLRMLDIGCCGAMISRASVGAPWLIGQIHEAMQLGEKHQLLSQDEIWDVFLGHVFQLSHLLASDHFALLHAKGLIKYYVKRNHLPSELLAQVRSLQTLSDLRELKKN